MTFTPPGFFSLVKVRMTLIRLSENRLLIESRSSALPWLVFFAVPLFSEYPYNFNAKHFRYGVIPCTLGGLPFLLDSLFSSLGIFLVLTLKTFILDVHVNFRVRLHVFSHVALKYIRRYHCVCQFRLFSLQDPGLADSWPFDLFFFFKKNIAFFRLKYNKSRDIFFVSNSRELFPFCVLSLTALCVSS